MRIAVSLFTAATLLTSAALPAAQQPVFEVASVRPNHTPVVVADDSSISIEPGGTLRTVNYPLRMLILFAYQIQNFQLEAPDWILSARFDIVARPAAAAAAPAAANISATRTMLQGLLADRFKLALHRETKERPIYELVRARDDGQPGPQLRQATGDCAARRAGVQNGAATNRPGPPGPGGCGVSIRLGRIGFGGEPITVLGDVLSRVAQRVVVDRTGLTGEWDFELTFSSDPSSLQLPPGSLLPPVAANADANGPALLTALEEQLGLKLQPTRGPVEMLVVDRVQQPGEN